MEVLLRIFYRWLRSGNTDRKTLYPPKVAWLGTGLKASEGGRALSGAKHEQACEGQYYRQDVPSTVRDSPSQATHSKTALSSSSSSN